MAKAKIHHSAGMFQLVLWDGSRHGKPLNHYLEKKPDFCVDCCSWVGRCLRGHKGTVASSDVCGDFKPKNNITAAAVTENSLHVKAPKVHVRSSEYVDFSADCALQGVVPA